MSYNWNQLHKWRDGNREWFLKKRLGKEGQDHVQYPVYTSAQYNQFENGESNVEVRAQGKNIADYLTVCNQATVDTRVEDTFEDVADTTTLATAVNAAIAMKDTIFNVFIGLSVAKAFSFTCFFVLSLKLTYDAELYVTTIVLMTAIYFGELQMNDTWIHNLYLMTSCSLLCWLVTVSYTHLTLPTICSV